MLACKSANWSRIWLVWLSTGAEMSSASFSTAVVQKRNDFRLWPGDDPGASIALMPARAIAGRPPPRTRSPQISHARLASFDGTELDVQTAGSDGPMIVIVNGLGGAIMAWRGLLDHFGPGFRVMSFDYRGLYDSEPPPNPEAVRIEDHYQDLRRVIDYSGERRVVLVGWSMGVQVAVEYALSEPANVAGLVLVCGAPGDPFAGVFGTSLSRLAVPALCRAVEAQPELFGIAVRACVVRPDSRLAPGRPCRRPEL